MSSSQDDGKLLTTGEIAQACGVSVRTVQYYDERGLLVPTERSEGGRRLYDEAALSRLQSICLLKSLGLPLKAIRGVLASESSPEVLRTILREQEKALSQQLATDQATLDAVRAMLAQMSAPASDPAPAQKAAPEHQTSDSADAAAAAATGPVAEEQTDHALAHPEPDMERNMSKIFADKSTRLYRTQRKMILEAIAMGIVEWACIIGGIVTGNWWPLAAAAPLIVIITAELVWMYHRDARYVCPHCGATFQPSIREFTFAYHTPKTRKLTCAACGTKDWCAEVAAPDPR